MKKCSRCGRLASPHTMVCQCGHSFVSPREPLRPGGRLPGDLGCFIWLFVANAVSAGLFAAYCLWPVGPGGDVSGGFRAFGWLYVVTAVISSVEAVGLALRRKFAYNLGMVLCWPSILNFPVGTILTVILMTGLARQRQWLTR